MGSNIIKLGIPAGYDADEVVVTLRRRVEVIPPGSWGSLGLPDPPPPLPPPPKQLTQGDSVKCRGCDTMYVPKRKDQMFHNKACRIAFYKDDKENKPKARNIWTTEAVAYLVKNRDAGMSFRDIARHVGHPAGGCTYKYYEIKSKAKSKPQQDEAVAALMGLGYRKRESVKALEGLQGTVEERVKAALQGLAPVSHRTNGQSPDPSPDPPGGSMGQEDDDAHAEIESLTATAPGTLGDVAGDPDEPEKAEPLWKQAYYRLKPDGKPPDDFDPQQRFGLDCYVWHAPCKEVGKVLARNQAGNFEVDFHGTIKTFMPEAAQFMFAEMMRKFGKPR